MPLNMNDPNVKAEIQPPQLLELGDKLKAFYQVGAAHFGIKGDENHLSGYHRSRNTLVHTPGASGSGDYSIQHSLDTQNMSWDDCSAFDMTPHNWGSTENNRRMIDATNRMYNASKKFDPRIQQCREYAGTFDGHSVVRFRCDGGAIQSPFDSSHLEHMHVSLWRSRVRWNHQGLYEVITGDDMLTPDQQQQLTNIHDWMFDSARGLVAADPGTPHIAVYKPNEWLNKLITDVTTLLNRPTGGVPTDEQMEAMAERVAELLEPNLEAAAEAAVRKVLGSLDGATP